MASRIAFFVVLAIAAGGIYMTQIYVDARTNRTPEVQMKYLLQSENLQRVSLGYPQLVADLIWIKAIQYYHQQFINRFDEDKKDHKPNYKWLAEISDLVTELNPKFVHAYWYFSLYLGGAERDTKGRYDASASDAMKLLHKGYTNNPETHFIAGNLAFAYLTYYRRLDERVENFPITEEERAALMARYRDQCIFFGDVAAGASDAPDWIQIWPISSRKVLQGDQCEGARLLVDRYNRCTQDLERQDALFATVLAQDRCNCQQLLERARAQGVALVAGDAASLASAIGGQLPLSPWGGLEIILETNQLPPERFEDLIEPGSRPRHRYEYFVSISGELISWYEGEKRELSQRGGATGIASRFKQAHGFWPRDIGWASKVLDQELVPNPFGRRYVVDLFDGNAYSELEEEDLTTRMIPWYERAPMAERRGRAIELIRSLDSAICRKLQDGPIARSPTEPGVAPDLTVLVPQLPASPWRLLPVIAKLSDEELPVSARELFALAPPPAGGPPSYVFTMEHGVMAREMAARFREELVAVLQSRLDEYWKLYSAPPTLLADLTRTLPVAFPGDPLGGEFAISEDGRTIVSRSD